MNTQMRRPDGISVIAVLNIVGGVLMMLAAFAAPQGALGALQFGFGVAGLAIGIGLFRLRLWVRWAAIGGYTLNIIGGLAEGNIPMVIIAALILPYLFSAGVRETFATRSAAVPVLAREKEV